MIDRITLRDTTEGEFVYERTADEPFRWVLTWPNGVQSDLKSDGRDVLWEVVLAITQDIDS